MFEFVTAAYQGFKLMLLDLTGLSRDALHMHIGLTILFSVRLAWRGKRAWLVAWCAAFVFALLGELFDWRSESLRGGAVAWSAHWHDIWNTLLWPSVLALVGWRIERRALSGEPKPLSENAEQPLKQA